MKTNQPHPREFVGRVPVLRAGVEPQSLGGFGPSNRFKLFVFWTNNRGENIGL